MPTPSRKAVAVSVVALAFCNHAAAELPDTGYFRGLELLSAPCIDAIVLNENFQNGRVVDEDKLNALNHYLNGAADAFYGGAEGATLGVRAEVFSACLENINLSIVEIVRNLHSAKE